MTKNSSLGWESGFFLSYPVNLNQAMRQHCCLAVVLRRV